MESFTERRGARKYTAEILRQRFFLTCHPWGMEPEDEPFCKTIILYHSNDTLATTLIPGGWSYVQSNTELGNDDCSDSDAVDNFELSSV